MGETKLEYEYLVFRHKAAPAGRKTEVYGCYNRRSGAELGEVRWHGPRQYCYFPTVQAVYSAGCLRDIAEFLESRKGGAHVRT